MILVLVWMKQRWQDCLLCEVVALTYHAHFQLFILSLTPLEELCMIHSSETLFISYRPFSSSFV